MGIKVKKVIFGLGFVLMLLLTGCGEPEGVIPSAEMGSILAEFYLADAEVEMAQEEGSKEMRYVDSLKVYEPILEKHGFTKEEFRASLNYYLHDPKKLNRSFQRAAAQLEAKADEKPGVVMTDETEEAPDKPEDWVDLDRPEGSEPAIEKEEPVKQKDKDAKSRPQRKMRKKLTRQELKQLEEELKKSNE